MKLDQCHKQQRKCCEEAKCDPEVLGKEKSAKTKHPSHQHHDLELTRGVRFQNLERYENDKERYARLNSLEGTIAGEDGEEGHGREHQFQSCKTKAVPFWLHPEFHCECEQKKARNPRRERAEHWRQCEEQRSRQPKQRPPWNTPVPVSLAHAIAPLTGTD